MMRPFARRGEFLGLTWGLMFLHAVGFVLIQTDRVQAYSVLALTPASIASGHWWSFFTYQFLTGSPVSLLFNIMSLYFLGLALEHEWGTSTYAVFYLAGVFGASGAAWALGLTLMGSVFLSVSFLITYAFLWPDVEFLVAFVLPVKVKWLAAVSAGWVIYAGLGLGFLGELVYVLGMGAGVIFYLALIRQKRRFVREVVTAVKEAGRLSGEAKLEVSNRDFFRRAQALLGAARGGDGANADLQKLRADLESSVAPEVKVCKPVDYKGDGDDICVHCEGFAECTLRYLKGEPAEILAPRKGNS